MTQDHVARHLDVSRSTVAQMELGRRMVSGLELSRLAHLFGKDVRSFVADEPSDDEDPLVALFRLHPELCSQSDVLVALSDCVALGRELTNLERLLAIDRDLATLAAYPLPRPRNKWEAIQQGERIAQQERRRLGLGMAALPDLVELLEGQGIQTAQVDLPDDISGLTLIEPAIGVFVVANRMHHILRRRFSYAHEYCHVLVDRDEGGLVSRGRDRDELLEVRANAFAASLLMPTEAVRQFVHALGKGHPSRMEAEVFDEAAAVRGRARSAPGSQAVQIYDVVQLAYHFGVSRMAAIYRLKSIHVLTSTELESLLEQDRRGRGREMEELLGLSRGDHQVRRNEFRHRFVGLALEAFRRAEISKAKLVEVSAMVGVAASDVHHAILDLGLDDEAVEIIVPDA